MAAKKKKTTKRRSTKSGWMDMAKLVGGLATVAAITTSIEKYQDGEALNPFTKEYWTG